MQVIGVLICAGMPIGVCDDLSQQATCAIQQISTSYFDTANCRLLGSDGGRLSDILYIPRLFT